MTSKCPLCAAAVELPSGTEIGELIDCGECGEELEVITLEPAELAPAPQEEEDWGE